MASGSSGLTSAAQTAIAQTAIALQKDGHKGVVVKSGIGRGKFICEIPNGTTLEVLEEKHGHYHVRFEGKEGWAKACNFSEVTTATEEPVTTAIEDADDADKEKVTTAIEETVPLAIEDADGDADGPSAAPTSAPCPTPTSAPASLCEEPEGEDTKEPPAKVRRTRRTVAAPKVFGRGGQWTRRTVAAPKAMPSAASAPRPTPTSAPVDLVESAQKALPAAPKGLRKAKDAPKTLGSFGLRVAYGRSHGIYHKESWSLSTDDIFSAVPRPAPKPTATRHRRRITVAIEDIQ